MQTIQVTRFVAPIYVMLTPEFSLSSSVNLPLTLLMVHLSQIVQT